MATNKTLIILLKLAVSSGSLYFIFRKADIGQVTQIIKSIGSLYFMAAAVLYILSLSVAAIRWKYLLPERFSYGKLFSLYMMGSFFSNFLPGIVGGDAVRAYYLNKDAKKISLSLASIFMDRYLGFVSLMIIGITAFPFSQGYFGESPAKFLMPIIFISFVIVSFLFFGLQLGKKFKMMTEVYEYFSIMKNKKDVMVKAIILSFVLQFMNFFMVIILASKMGENISLLALSVFLPIVITITSLPISISGIGVREGSFVLLLGLIGIKPEIATSLSLAWFFSVVVGSMPGLLFYLTRNKISQQD